ncbi:MAG TPA: hypothetical protein VNU94_09080 [Acidobacteriaceae bacterium]|nr:hypothetical protein [Acidobacteriaceae bacterium]
MKITTLALAAFMAAAPAAFTASAQAQDINQRKENQQDRIAQGVKSGELTPGETAHLENQEKDINHEEKDMRKTDDGHLTSQDRKAIHQQQNAESRRIYRDKHNARKS